MKRFVGVTPASAAEVRAAPQAANKPMLGGFDSAVASISSRMGNLSAAGMLSPPRTGPGSEGSGPFRGDPVLSGTLGTTLRRGERTPTRGAVKPRDYVPGPGAPGAGVQLMGDGASASSGDVASTQASPVPDSASVASGATMASALAAAVGHAAGRAVATLTGAPAPTIAASATLPPRSRRAQHHSVLSSVSGATRRTADRVTKTGKKQRKTGGKRSAGVAQGASTFAWRQKVKAAAAAATAHGSRQSCGSASGSLLAPAAASGPASVGNSSPGH